MSVSYEALQVAATLLSNHKFLHEDPKLIDLLFEVAKKIESKKTALR